MLSCQGKSHSVIPVIIYCAWPEGSEFGTSYGYVATYEDLGTGEGMTKAYRMQEHGKCSHRQGMTGEILATNPQANRFHDFLCPGDILLTWFRTRFIPKNVYLQSNLDLLRCRAFLFCLFTVIVKTRTWRPFQPFLFSISVYLIFLKNHRTSLISSSSPQADFYYAQNYVQTHIQSKLTQTIMS